MKWNTDHTIRKLTAGICSIAMVSPAVITPALATGWSSYDNTWTESNNWSSYDNTWTNSSGWNSFDYNYSDNTESMLGGVVYDGNGARCLTENGLYYVDTWLSAYGRWYYFDETGMSTPGWKEIAGKWYFFDTDCLTMNSGWTNIDGQYYYFNTDGSMRKGWMQTGRGWYFLKSSGTRAVSEWIHINDEWYYFDNSGYMVTGWLNLDGKSYCFDNNGIMYTGTVNLDGTNYTFASDGSLLTSVVAYPMPHGSAAESPTEWNTGTPTNTTPHINSTANQAVTVQNSWSTSWNSDSTSTADSSYLAKMQSFISDARFANGAYYDGNHAPTFFNSPARGCVAYSLDFVYAVFGIQANPLHADYYDINEIRSGDVLHFNSPVHTVVVLERNGNSLYTAEGNFAGQVRVSRNAYTIKNGIIYSGSTPVSFAYGAHYN